MPAKMSSISFHIQNFRTPRLMPYEIVSMDDSDTAENKISYAFEVVDDHSMLSLSLRDKCAATFLQT